MKNIDDVKLSDNLISSIDAKCNFEYLRLLNSINILKQIDDNLLVKMDNCMLTERDLAKMREYMVKDANMNYENKFIIADSCDTIDLPEVIEYDFDGDKVLKL